MRLEQKIAKILTSQKRTLAVAESCSGGLLSHTLTEIPGSSVFFKLGIVAYDNAAKIKLLKVPQQHIALQGVISTAVANDMAKGVRNILKTDYGIGITGIAGPAGGSKLKPVGLTCIAVCSDNKSIAEQFHFKGDRSRNKTLAKNTALRMLLKLLA